MNPDVNTITHSVVSITGLEGWGAVDRLDPEVAPQGSNSPSGCTAGGAVAVDPQGLSVLVVAAIMS